MQIPINVKADYLRMLKFLEAYGGGVLDITLGELLGAMSLSDDGDSMDPAALEIWLRLHNVGLGDC